MAQNKQRSPAMQFYFRQFAADDAVTSMDLDAVGAHILLMCAAGSASSGYQIPADDRAIRVRLRNPSEADFQRIKAQLLAGAWKISPCGKWWIQDGMRRTLLKQKEFSRLQSERAKGSRNKAETKPKQSRIEAETPSSSTTSTASTSSNINTPLPPKGEVEAPPSLRTTACLNAISDWISHRKEIKKKLTNRSLKAIYKEFDGRPEELIAAIHHSIKNCWIGLFPPGKNGGVEYKTKDQLEREDWERITAKQIEIGKKEGLI